ncbi:MAG: hypothetical protein ACPHSD_19720 [Candidatus Latescibacterota bacterium]|jgi:hypothetical protein
MAKFYKASNKRMIARGKNGRFRKTILADLGIGVCRECDEYFAPHFELAQNERGTIDIVKMNQLKHICPACGDYEPRPEPKNEGLSSLQAMIEKMADVE